MSDAQKILGACLRALREQQRLSLESLAARAGISYQYLSGVETGKENFTIQVLESLAGALGVPVKSLVATAYERAEGISAPLLNKAHFRQVPLPEGLALTELEAAANLTQSMIHRINRNMQLEVGCTLQSIIQGNNFSGLVSNILSNAMDQCSDYKHNHDQKYPDLIYKSGNGGEGVGLEVKTTVNVGKGGESHNGHSGWHLIACYNFVGDGDIQFVHLMLADLNGHKHAEPDWRYVGSKENADTGSRRTETYTTNLFGATKLRDGSAFLDPARVNFSRWKKQRRPNQPRPDWSIFSS